MCDYNDIIIHNQHYYIGATYDNEKLKCDHCEYVTPWPNSLRNHMRIHTGDMLKCTFTNCEYTTNTASRLRVHMVIHSENFLKCKIYYCITSIRFERSYKRSVYFFLLYEPITAFIQKCLYSVSRISYSEWMMLGNKQQATA